MQLADESQRLGRAEDRERFMLLAADAALQAGQPTEAEKLRRNILANNPNYFLKPYPSFAEAMKAPDILKYVQDLRKHYSPEQAERWLQSLRGQGPMGGNVDRAALATLQPHQATRSAPLPAPTAPVPQLSPNVFQMAPRRPEGPQRGEPPQRANFQLTPGRRRRRVREIQPGAWIGAFLFLVLLAASLGAVAHQFVLPFVGGR
jgi:hypothetical protein